MSCLSNDRLRPLILLAHGKPDIRELRYAAYVWKCAAFHDWYYHRGRHKHKLDKYDPEDHKTFVRTRAWLAFENWVLDYAHWVRKQEVRVNG